MGVVSRADLSLKHLQIIQKILAAFFPSCSVWAYGSRAKWTARATSDLDMVIFADVTNKRKLSQLREAFEESNLPFEVDAFLWDLVPENFRTHILESYVVLQENKQTVVPLVPLKDYCLKIGSGSTPRGGSSVYLKEGATSFIRSQNIYNDKFDPNGLVYLSEGAAEKLKNVALLSGDILLNITGDSVARVNLVPDKYLPARVNQHVAIIRPNPADFDARYLRYVLTSVQHQSHLLTLASAGATRNALTKGMIESYLVPKPPLLEQHKIANLLSAFDDKITLNNQINQTLEQMAQAIFKSWFVDFDPVKAKMNGEQPKGMDAATASLFPEKLVESELGLIPEGWEVNQLSDICKNHSQSYNLKSVDEVVFVNTGDVQEGDFLHKNYSPVVGLPGQAKKAIKEDDILYSEIRPKNKRFAYVDFDVSDYVVSTKFMVIQANEKVHPRLLYMILTRQNTIDEFNIIADSRSGTFPQITFRAISNLEFCMAPREIQDAFVSQIMPMIKLQSSLKSENKQLAEMRDTLLPKLLSGEIDLENLPVEQAKALAE